MQGSETSISEQKSSFLVTISTNKVPKSAREDRELRSALKESITEYLKKDNLYPSFKFVQGRRQDFSQIKKVKVTGIGIEKGSDKRGGRIHAHFHMDVYHNSRIQLDRTRIRDFVLAEINKRLTTPLTNIYVNIKWVKTAFYSKKYVGKERIVIT
jgi:hypothetical protein